MKSLMDVTIFFTEIAQIQLINVYFSSVSLSPDFEPRTYCISDSRCAGKRGALLNDKPNDVVDSPCRRSGHNFSQVSVAARAARFMQRFR
jgi:hypothetical protein